MQIPIGRWQLVLLLLEKSQRGNGQLGSVQVSVAPSMIDVDFAFFVAFLRVFIHETIEETNGGKIGERITGIFLLESFKF